MFGRRKSEDDEDDAPKRAPDHSWSTRVAWCVLMGGGALLALRASVATVVQVHGDGMAPTIVNGDTVLLIRGKWSVGRGDVVAYDPLPIIPEPVGNWSPPIPAPGDGRQDDTYRDARKPEAERMRNTAVVDRDEFEGNWERVREKSGVDDSPSRVLRIGRILATPGDTVTFNVHDAAMGLSVNGTPIQQKVSDPIRIVLKGQPELGEDPSTLDRPHIRGTAYEWIGDVRYSVLTSTAPMTGLRGPQPVRWPKMSLPAEQGPVEVMAPGYLIVADNRDEGACCDSRAIGWVSPQQLEGEVVARIAGNTNATPDLDPAARGPAWLP